jgi:hypothetical protein
LHANFGDRLHFVAVLIRQAHPGPSVYPYRSFDEKFRDAYRYRQYKEIPWPVLVDDLEGSVHQVYSCLADPTYVIDTDGRVAFYNMWTYAPALYDAIQQLLEQGGRGVVKGGIDHLIYPLPAMTDGWRGIRLGLPQSYLDMETAAPGSALLLWLGYRLRPLLAPLALRAKPLPQSIRMAMTLGLTALLGAGLWRMRKA